MSCKNVKIFSAVESDLPDVLALLTSVNLPHEGVKDNLSGFLVARDEEGRLAGTVGLEQHGSVGLLRSAAVAKHLQHWGLGSCLTATLLEAAKKNGAEKVVLLTTTASDFFSRRFGFSEVNRTDYEEQLASSSEWKLPRCSTAVCMSLDLNSETVTGGSSN